MSDIDVKNLNAFDSLKTQIEFLARQANETYQMFDESIHGLLERIRQTLTKLDKELDQIEADLKHWESRLHSHSDSEKGSSTNPEAERMIRDLTLKKSRCKDNIRAVKHQQETIEEERKINYSTSQPMKQALIYQQSDICSFLSQNKADISNYLASDALSSAGQFADALRSKSKSINGNNTYNKNVKFMDKEIVQMADIDWDKETGGKTNREWARAGKAPYGHDGQRITIHHFGQDASGPYVEATASVHSHWTGALHNAHTASFRNDAALDSEFEAFKKKYWVFRADS